VVAQSIAASEAAENSIGSGGEGYSRSQKKDGSGRAAAAVAEQFAVSQATVYQARRIQPRTGGGRQVRQSLIKAACRTLQRAPETLMAAGKAFDGGPPLWYAIGELWRKAMEPECILAK
jgi:hypothetical protein